MRQNKSGSRKKDFSILTVDDDPLMTSTLQTYFRRSGYRVEVENNPVQAVERVRLEGYDILLLDFLMTPICGDQVVARIREFNRDIFIILLTGHKSMAPPIRTIRELDIQGYYEKSERFDQLELLVESCTKAIVQMRTIRGYQQGLAVMMEALPAIYSLQAVEHIADAILKIAVSVLGGARCALIFERMPPVQEGCTGEHLIRCLGLPVQRTEAAMLLELVRREGTSAQDCCLNLALRDEADCVVGLLRVEFDSEPSRVQLLLAEVLVRQGSVAIQNACLHGLLYERSEALAAVNNRMKDNYTEMISAIRLMVDAKDFYTRGHSDRVAYLAELMARQMGKSEAYCRRIRVAGLFHDVGKMSIPDSILLKDSFLTDGEYESIKRHPAAGANILMAMSQFHDIVPIVRSHHERYDGTGYPDGLVGEEITEEASIISVADSYDAMTSNRRYRGSLGMERALSELRRCSGTQFAPFAVEAFLRIPAEDLNFEEKVTEAAVGLAAAFK